MAGRVNISARTKIADNSVDLIGDILLMEYVRLKMNLAGNYVDKTEDRYNAYMYRSAPTKGYQQTEFTYSIDQTYVNHAGQYCEIYYTVAAVIDKMNGN